MEMLSAFLLDLYRLARACPPAGFQDAALDMLAVRVKFDSARWASSRILPNGDRKVIHFHLKDESTEASAAYLEVMRLDWPMLDLLRHRSNPIGAISYQSAECFGAKEMSPIRDYQRRFRHANVINAAHKSMAIGDSHFRHFSLYRAHEKHRFTNGDLTFARMALPHLLEAQAVSAAVSDVSSPSGELAASRSNVADLGGFLLSDNASLRMLLQDEWPGWKPPRLPAPLWDALCSQHGFCGRQIVAAGSRVEDLVVFRVRRRCAAETLSRRELEVARRVADGDGHKQIARALGISPATARNHVQHIHDKLNARNAADVIAALARSSLNQGRVGAGNGESKAWTR